MFIENQLSELIRHTGRAVVPGIGQFQLEYKPAVIDYIQKNVSPPGKFVSFVFNESLNTANIPDSQCAEIEKILWETEGQKWQERLNNKETILLPNVGSIYKDFRGDIHFLPAAINYDDASFGLRNLKIEPVVRKSEQPSAGQVSVKPVLPKSEKSTFQFADTLFSVLIGLTLIVISFGVWYAMSSKQISRPASKFQVAESTLEQVRNLEDLLDYDGAWTVPGFQGDSAMPQDEELANPEIVATDEQPREITAPVPAVPTNPVTKTEVKEKLVEKTKPSAMTEVNYNCKISVGAFSNEANARALTKKLSGKGYKSSIQSGQTGGLSRVVVMAPCESAALNAMLSKIKADFNAGAFVVQ